MILEIMKREVTIREGETIKKITNKEAVMRAQVATALKGNPLAQRELTHLTMRCEKEAEEAKWKEYHFWREYKEEKAAQAARGEVFDDPYPLADDIVLHNDGRVTFNGPVSLKQEAELNIVMAKRDAFFIYGIWQGDYLTDQDPDDITTQISFYTLFARWLNMLLPLNLRWDEDKLNETICHHALLSKREFHSLLKEIWHKVFDCDFEPSTNPPSAKQLAQSLGFPTFWEFMEHCRNNPVDKDEYEQALRELDIRLFHEEQQKKSKCHKNRKHVPIM